MSRASSPEVSQPVGISTTAAQRVRAPLCDRCGAVMQLRWVDVSTSADVEPRWMLDTVRCLTPGCRAGGSR
ncbi:MAG TPA: hypothetical protein VN738_02830 [Acidothermaceae bacterium]|nr:hypothetical protein [Acidothermaceae bacterium]